MTAPAFLPQDKMILPTGGLSPSWQRFFLNVKNSALSGTVTSISINPANGISGTVGNPTTTPSITLALGAITPTSVASSGTVTGSNLSGTNTGDQTITLTGDATGSGTGSFAVNVARVNGVSFAGLATGLLKNTTGTGVPSIAAAGSDYIAPGGALGTPSNGTLTNCSGLPISTGVAGLGSGVATFLATPSSANLAAALTDKTGTGVDVFATNPTISNPLLSSVTYFAQSSPASIGAAATLTAAQMLGGIIQYTGAAASLTLPLGSDMDAGVVANLPTNYAFELCFVNTGTGVATITANTGFTVVGSVTVTNATSARYRCQKTAANTYVAYRVG